MAKYSLKDFVKVLKSMRSLRVAFDNLMEGYRVYKNNQEEKQADKKKADIGDKEEDEDKKEDADEEKDEEDEKEVDEEDDEVEVEVEVEDDGVDQEGGNDGGDNGRDDGGDDGDDIDLREPEIMDPDPNVDDGTEPDFDEGTEPSETK